jgi:hypothetical protein
MGTFVFEKTMIRNLTSDEEAQVVEYCKAHPKEFSYLIAEHFEKVFGTPVTNNCILTIMINDALKRA